MQHDRGLHWVRRLPLWAAVSACTWIPLDCAAADHALLVGISDYTGTGLMSLRGPDNDIALMRGVLMQRFGMSGKDIVTLSNAHATHSAIQKAFADLAAHTVPGDFVYIHYSGHGSYATDKNDPHGFDQTWVSYGSRAARLPGIDDHDVLDKEINQWLQPLYKITPNVVFVSDSCYSATVSRGGSLQGVRFAPPDLRPHPLVGKTSAVSSAMPGLRIGAARDVESAVEVIPSDGSGCTDKQGCNGVFTWYWAQSLQRAQPGESWADVFNRAYTNIVTRPYVMQRPQEEGHAEGLVFGGHYAAVRPTVAITAINGGTGAATVEIGAGAVSDVTQGSVYRLYAPGKPGGLGAARVEITGVEPLSSHGAIRDGKLAVGDPLIEETHAYPFKPIRLFIQTEAGSSADAALRAKLEAALRRLPGFEVATQRTDALAVVYLFHPGQVGESGDASGHLPTSQSGAPPQVWVLNPQGKLLGDQLRIPMSDSQKGIDALCVNLSRFARAREVRALESSGGAPVMAVQISAYRADPGCRQNCFYLPADARKSTPYRKLGVSPLAKASSLQLKRSDALAMSLSNVDGDKKAWYGYLLDIGSNGFVQAVTPTRYDNREAARFDPDETRDLANQAVVILNTVGVETIKLISTTQPIDVSLFETSLPAAQRNAASPLERLLDQAMSTRGAIERKTVSDWQTLQGSFEVK